VRALRFAGYVLLLALASLPFSAPYPLSAASATIDARVLEDTADGKVGNFLVLLKSPSRGRSVAGNVADRERHGRLVFEALRQTAQTTQPAVQPSSIRLGQKSSVFDC
jgi:hypothetical protein